MKSAVIVDKKNLKSEKKLWRQLDEIVKHHKHTSGTTKKFRIVQSVNAGHIRGGHAFH